MKLMTIVALVLVIVGGLNWGLVGLFKFNLVTTLFGEASMLSSIVFIAVGLSAAYVAAVVLPKQIK